MSTLRAASHKASHSDHWATQTLDAALGRTHREDSVAPKTGGVAGNAALSAWTGLLLLVLFAAEGFTLLSIRGLLTWHIAIGALLIPPVLLKMGSTGWRMISYYTHRAAYLRSGPPPIVFRVLGPFVVLTSVALLASGVLLILVGQSASRTEFFSFLGFRVDWIFVHQVSFFAWVAAMTLHVLGRTIPALQIAGDRVRRPRAIPGIGRRLSALVAVTALGIGCAFVLVDVDSSWRHDSRHDFQGHQRAGAHGAVSVFLELRGEGPVAQG